MSAAYSTNETAAELLHRAAAEIDRLAAKVTPAPWSGYVQPDASRGEVFAGPFEDGYLTGSAFSWCEESVQEYGGLPSAPDVAWLSMMGPQIAKPLVAWLRSEAERPSSFALDLAIKLVGDGSPAAVVVIVDGGAS